MARPSPRSFLLLAGLALLPWIPAPAAGARIASARIASTGIAPAAVVRPAEELFEVARVVDGDTIHVMRAGVLEKLRLLSVDTEEKLTGSGRFDPLKPQTVFGEECALWAQEFFAELGQEGQAPRVGLRFPGGEEERDVFGRLLCHVILPDGRDFNLLLVEQGKSPYFNKYGNSRIAHEEFVAAQRRARAAKLGIWNPETNVSKDPDSPSVIRPYAQLLPWWQARADAIEGFRARLAEGGPAPLSAEDPEALVAAIDGEAVEVFGAVDRTFEEQGGELTVLLRSADRDRSLRVRLPKRVRKALAELDLEQRGEPLRQNYVWVRGRITKGSRGPSLRLEKAGDLRLAGPEPVIPEPRRGD